MIYTGELNNLFSGYAQAGLHHLNSLVMAGYKDISIFSRHAIPWQTFPAWCEPLRLLPNGASRDIILVHYTPDQLANTVKRETTKEGKAIRYLGMTAIDADRCPRWAAVAINRIYEKVIVPSEHCKKSALNSRIEIPIVVVPHTMHPYLWENLPKIEKKPTPYIFYYIGSWNTRKNPEGVIRSYVRAFPEVDGKTRLVLKLTAQDSVRYLIDDLIVAEMRQQGISVPDDYRRSDVSISSGYVPEREIAEIHAYGDCYVSLHRGEAFGIACFEAALLGKQVVYTNWSGVTDFLNPDVHLPVPHTMVQVSGMAPHVHFGPDQRWAEPDLDDASRQMRLAFNKPAGDYYKELRERFSYARCGQLLKEALQ